MVDNDFVSGNPRNLEVLPWQKYPVQTTAPATLITAGDFIKSLLAAIRAVGKLYPVTVPFSPLPVLPIYSCTSGHASMPRSQQCYQLPLPNASPSPWSLVFQPPDVFSYIFRQKDKSADNLNWWSPQGSSSVVELVY